MEIDKFSGIVFNKKELSYFCNYLKPTMYEIKNFTCILWPCFNDGSWR